MASAANTQQQMQVHKSANRISKTRILPAKVQKNQFNIPPSNRYFAKILHQRPIISHSLEPSHAKLSTSLKSSREIDISFSLEVRRKDSVVRDKIQIATLNNLPHIRPKHKKQRSAALMQANEIINSELGTLSFNMILGLTEKSESNREQYGRKSVLRINSITSDQISIDGEQAKSRLDMKQGQEKSYEEYDRLLMTKQPAFYKPKRFNLKHKAEWAIPSCAKT